MAVIGYARVSTTDQNPQLQLDALQEAGAARIYTDHGVSGSAACRPHLDACLDHLREADVLTVWKLDRLGPNTQHVLAVVDQLTSRGIGFRSLTEGMNTDGPMRTAMLTIMAGFAQLDRDTMIERTRAGLAACVPAPIGGRCRGMTALPSATTHRQPADIRTPLPWTQLTTDFGGWSVCGLGTGFTGPGKRLCWAGRTPGWWRG